MKIPKVPREVKVQVMTRVTVAQRERLLAIAAANRCTLARVLEHAIEMLLDEDDRQRADGPSRVDPAPASGGALPERSSTETTPAQLGDDAGSEATRRTAAG